MDGKKALILIAMFTSPFAQAKTVCRVSVDGQRAAFAGTLTDGSAAFTSGSLTVLAQRVPGKPNRIQFTLAKSDSTKGAYVIAAFRDGRLLARPTINGQQLSLSCLQK